MTDCRVLVVVPAHNESISLLKVIREIKHAGYDAIIINDASTDNTEEIAKKGGFPVISLPVNLGIGGGVQTGFMYAVRNGYDIVVQVDGDGQHDPGQIQVITGPILAGEADCVIGSRYLPNAVDTGYFTPLLRRLGMHFSSTILWAATGLMIYDTTSGFRALNREAFSFFAVHYPVDHPEAESLLILHQEDFRIKELSISMRGRQGGQSLFTMWRAFIYPFRVIVGFAGEFKKNPRCKKK